MQLQKIIPAFFLVVLALVLFDSFRPVKVPTREDVALVEKPCKGTPISVDFPFEWTVSKPHSCAPQCADGKPRYILYSDGQATQCEDPPGCNDYGEDNGITCTPPGAASVKASVKGSVKK